jgi:hypothetical protein
VLILIVLHQRRLKYHIHITSCAEENGYRNVIKLLIFYYIHANLGMLDSDMFNDQPVLRSKLM